MIKNILYKILGINILTIDDIHQNVNREIEDEQASHILAYVTFHLMDDGTVNAKTEWKFENNEMAIIYAQLLYQIGIGSLEEGVLNLLFEYGKQNVKSQPFINNIFTALNEYKSKYQNLPIISPSQALSVKDTK
jgi:hypothetical protein